jgi:hypothetical protein
MAAIQIGQTRQQVTQTLGTPVRESSESGMTVLWYGSKSPTMADLYVFRDGMLVLRTESHYRQPKMLSEYTKTYGVPAVSVTKYGTSARDSLNLIVHVWPEAGKAVTSVGTDADSTVIGEDTFASTTLSGYLSTWGKPYDGNPTVPIGTGTVSGRQPGGPGWLPITGVLLVIAVLTAAGFFIFRRHHASR